MSTRTVTSGARGRHTRCAGFALAVVLLAPVLPQLLAPSHGLAHGCRCGCDAGPGKQCSCCPARPAAGTVCISDGGCGGSAPADVRIQHEVRAALLPAAPRLFREALDEPHPPAGDAPRLAAPRALPDPVPRLIS